MILLFNNQSFASLQFTFAKVNYKRPFTFAGLQTPIYAFTNCKHLL